MPRSISLNQCKWVFCVPHFGHHWAHSIFCPLEGIRSILTSADSSGDSKDATLLLKARLSTVGFVTPARRGSLPNVSISSDFYVSSQSPDDFQQFEYDLEPCLFEKWKCSCCRQDKLFSKQSLVQSVKIMNKSKKLLLPLYILHDYCPSILWTIFLIPICFKMLQHSLREKKLNIKIKNNTISESKRAKVYFLDVPLNVP